MQKEVKEEKCKISLANLSWKTVCKKASHTRTRKDNSNTRVQHNSKKSVRYSLRAYLNQKAINGRIEEASSFTYDHTAVDSEEIQYPVPIAEEKRAYCTIPPQFFPTAVYTLVVFHAKKSQP